MIDLLEDVLSGEGEGQGLDSTVIAPDGWRIAGNLCIAVLACCTLQPLRGSTYSPRDVRGGLHKRDLRFGDPRNDGTRAYSLLVNAILRGHFGSLHPGHCQDVFHYLKTRCCLFCWCASYI